MAVEGPEEAVHRANDPPGGLSGSIWTRDISLARALARRLRTGSVCINDVLVNYFCVEAPLGGVPPSGVGFRHGPEALRQFCRTETILEDRPGCGRVSGYLARRLGFPYDARVLDTVRWVMRRRY
jgi:succinate-semialdehyde dehydrogenase/glutarate-semialdehyde dehydrogenase